jgi:hypothetical protein
MRTKTSSIPILAALICAFCLTPAFATAHAQSSSAQSVVEAARRDRERTKDAKKPAKVVTNDDLEPSASESRSSSANASSSSAAPLQPAAQASSETSSATSPADDQAVKKQQAAELSDLKKKLADAQSDLDLIQRQIALQQDTFYSNPDYIHDTAGKAQLDQMHQQASEKKQVVDSLKAQLDALQQTPATSASRENSAAPPQP